MIDPQGVIVSRSFETSYQERRTAPSILAGLTPAPSKSSGAAAVDGKLLSARLSVSDGVAAPGHRVTLIIDVTPGRKMHVYAPGQPGYPPIALVLESSEDFRSAPMRYPPAREYYFAPLKERVQVYSRPFRLLQDITLALTPSLRQRAAARETLTISGTLEYQACDDRICYRPETLPVQWRLTLTPIEAR